MPKPPLNIREFRALVEVVSLLRGPEGCPWDKEQTHQTLTQYAIEEAYELAEAIDTQDKQGLIEELGDLLLQVVLHSEIARQEQSFQLDDVIESLNEKMIRRHPHVFGDVKVTDSHHVLDNWAKIKAQEKKSEKSSDANGLKNSHSSAVENPFVSIPKALPALIRSQKIGGKTVRYNFDWQNPWQVVEKIEEELSELKEAMRSQSPQHQQQELGDVLFSVVQLARHLNFDAEQALRMTNSKFERRFLRMRGLVEKDGKIFSDLPTSELEKYWQKAKLLEE